MSRFKGFSFLIGLTSLFLLLSSQGCEKSTTNRGSSKTSEAIGSLGGKADPKVVISLVDQFDLHNIRIDEASGMVGTDLELFQYQYNEKIEEEGFGLTSAGEPDVENPEILCLRSIYECRYEPIFEEELGDYLSGCDDLDIESLVAIYDGKEPESPQMSEEGFFEICYEPVELSSEGFGLVVKSAWGSGSTTKSTSGVATDISTRSQSFDFDSLRGVGPSSRSGSVTSIHSADGRLQDNTPSSSFMDFAVKFATPTSKIPTLSTALNTKISDFSNSAGFSSKQSAELASEFRALNQSMASAGSAITAFKKTKPGSADMRRVRNSESQLGNTIRQNGRSLTGNQKVFFSLKDSLTGDLKVEVDTYLINLKKYQTKEAYLGQPVVSTRSWTKEDVAAAKAKAEKVSVTRKKEALSQVEAMRQRLAAMEARNAGAQNSQGRSSTELQEVTNISEATETVSKIKKVGPRGRKAGKIRRGAWF